MWLVNLLRKFYKLLFNEQYKAETFCRYIGSENKRKHKYLKKYLKKYLAKRYHIIIGYYTIIGSNLTIPHPQNIVIGEGAVIEDNVVIYQDVTIGAKDKDLIDIENLQSCYPHICDSVCIYAGAKIIGGICIEENCIIGSNAVVTKDTEKNGVYGGVPARLIKKKEDLNYKGGGKGKGQNFDIE